jgi:hypothetical protein
MCCADASLAHWERTAELATIEVPALVIGAQHDTMDPAHDQRVYFAGLIDFLRGLGGPDV